MHLPVIDGATKPSPSVVRARGNVLRHHGLPPSLGSGERGEQRAVAAPSHTGIQRGLAPVGKDWSGSGCDLETTTVVGDDARGGPSLDPVQVGPILVSSNRAGKKAPTSGNQASPLPGSLHLQNSKAKSRGGPHLFACGVRENAERELLDAKGNGKGGQGRGPQGRHLSTDEIVSKIEHALSKDFLSPFTNNLGSLLRTIVEIMQRYSNTLQQMSNKLISDNFSSDVPSLLRKVEIILPPIPFSSSPDSLAEKVTTILSSISSFHRILNTGNEI